MPAVKMGRDNTSRNLSRLIYGRVKERDVRCMIRKGVIYLARVDAMDKMEAAGEGQTDCVKL